MNEREKLLKELYELRDEYQKVYYNKDEDISDINFHNEHSEEASGNEIAKVKKKVKPGGHAMRFDDYVIGSEYNQQGNNYQGYINAILLASMVILVEGLAFMLAYLLK